MRLTRPSPRDAATAAAGAAALVVDGRLRATGAGLAPTILLAALTCAPLAWRRHAPVVSLLLLAAGLLACLAYFEPYRAAILVAMVALYAVGVLGDRRRSLVVGAGSAVFLVLVIAWLEPSGELTEGALRLTLVLSALVLGDTIRSRRALRDAARERALREQQDRDREARRRLDEDRLRIARELHDTIAHALVAINVRAGVAAHLRDRRDEVAALVEIKDVSADALRDLRGALDLLRDQDGGAPTGPAQDLRDLPELLERARAGGLDALADVEVAGTPIASPVGQAGFRIVQESLTNVLRHANATRARVCVRVVAGTLDIEVLDDGRATPAAGGGTGGHGLRGMAERAAALGGRVQAGPATDGGWRVHAQLPLTAGR